MGLWGLIMSPHNFPLIVIYIVVLLNAGIGMDASVTPLRHGGLSLVQTTDFFYPLVDDPYMMGKFIFSLEIFKN